MKICISKMVDKGLKISFDLSLSSWCNFVGWVCDVIEHKNSQILIWRHSQTRQIISLLPIVFSDLSSACIFWTNWPISTESVIKGKLSKCKQLIRKIQVEFDSLATHFAWLHQLRCFPDCCQFYGSRQVWWPQKWDMGSYYKTTMLSLPNSIFVLRSPWIFFPNVGLCSDCPVKSCPEGPSALSPASVRENCAPSPQGAVLMYRWNVTSGLTPSFPDGISLSMVWSGFCLYSANCLYMNLHGKKKWETLISDQVENSGTQHKCFNISQREGCTQMIFGRYFIYDSWLFKCKILGTELLPKLYDFLRSWNWKKLTLKMHFSFEMWKIIRKLNYWKEGILG